MLNDVLKSSDKKLLDNYFLIRDNDNLLHFLKNKEANFELLEAHAEDIANTVSKVKENIPIKRNRFPLL